MIIYKITNKKNGMAYVGLSVHDGRTRWRGHLLNARKQSPKQLIDKALRKHGHASFTYEVLETVDAERGVEFLESREQFWIHKLKTFDRRFGYNLALGTYTNVGHVRTSSYRSAAKVRGGVAVHQYTLKGRFVRSFSSIKSANEHCGFAGNVIANVVGGARRSAGGYLWVRATKGQKPVRQLPYVHQPFSRAKAVYCFERSGLLVAEYSSARRASEATGVPHKAISEVISGRSTTAGGYVWSEAPEISRSHLRRLAKKKWEGARRPRPVVLFSSSGSRVKTFASLRLAAQETQICLSSVSQSCQELKVCVRSEKFGLCRFRYLSDAPKKLGRLAENAIRRKTQQVAQYKMDGKRVKIHASIREAAQSLGCHENNITNAVRGRAVTSVGFQWRPHSELAPSPESVEPIDRSFVICQYNYHGDLVARHASCAAAAKAVNRSSSTIWQAVKGVTYSAAGHYWRKFAADGAPQRIKTPPPRGAT